MARSHKEALDEALRLFRAIEARHVDPFTGGYLEEFDATMKPRAARQLADGHEGVQFTANTHLHLLEAVTNLVKASGDALAKRTLHHLIHLLRDKHYHPECSSVAMYCDAAFECIRAPRSYGHDIEASWLIWEAAKELKLPEEHVRPMVEDLARNVYEHGYNGDYVRYEQNGEAIDDTMVWWVQCEAMVGFANAYRLTGNQHYQDATKRIYASVMERLVDQRPGGEWFWSVDADGIVESSRGMAELWKTTYHNVRALLELIERL
jgi:mannobiose 2-epimerase